MVRRSAGPLFVVAVVKELLCGAYHLDQMGELFNVYLAGKMLAILNRPEGLRPIADVAEVYECKNPPEFFRVEEQSVPPECMEIHGVIVRALRAPVKGVYPANFTGRYFWQALQANLPPFCSLLACLQIY
jgi:hypothetical protein